MILKRLLSQLCIFFLVFDPAVPPIKIFGGAPFSMLIAIVSLLVYGPASYVALSSLFRKTAVLSSIILFFVIVRIIFDEVFDISYLSAVIRVLITVTSSFLYLYVFCDKAVNKDLLLVLILSGLFACIAMNSSALLNIAIYFKAGDYSISDFSYNLFRISFLSGNSAFGIAVVYSIAIVYFTLWYTFVGKVIKSNCLFMLLMLLMFLFGYMAGRVTIFAGALSCVILFFHNRRNFASVFFVFLLSVLIGYRFIDFDSPTAQWAFESLINFYKSGSFNSNSTSQLMDMYNIPPDANLIFGDARFKNIDGSYYGSSDVGYIRHFLFGGVIYSLIIYLFLFVFSGINNRFFALYLVIIYLFLEAKGNVIFDFSPATFLMIFIVAVFCGDNKFISKRA